VGDRDASLGDTTRIPLDPAAAVRGGTFDPLALLVLWALRSATLTVLFGGLIYARLVEDRELNAIPEVTTPAQAWSVLLSPFAGIVIAIALRVLANTGGLALAYPFSRRATEAAPGPGFRRSFLVWVDRLHLARAYRSLRWTTTVRAHAADGLGRWGRALRWAGPALAIADVVLVVALLAVVWVSRATP
jgi:hypothetical protein